MRLPDDDELYQVDQTYLGPPRRYIAPMRHKAIFAWLGIAPLTFVVAAKAGLPMTFLSVGLLLMGTVWAAMTVADHATSERPVMGLFATFWHDLSAPRPDNRPDHADPAPFAAMVRPRGPLGRYLDRRSR
jgi:hypothetical protein